MLKLVYSQLQEIFRLLLLIITLPFIQGHLPFISPHTGSLFLTHGQLVSGLSWGHIISEIDLQQPRKDLDIYNEMIQAFYGLHLETKNPIVAKRLKILNHNCKSQIQNMNTTLNEINNGFNELTTLTRNKRQIGVGIAAIGGSIIGSVITSLFSQFHSSTLTDILDKRVNVLTARVDTNAIQITQNQADIKQINKTLSYINHELGLMLQTDKELEFEVISIFTNLLMDEQAIKINILADAITQIFAGKLHRGLISTEGLIQAFLQLKNQAQNKGLLVGSQNTYELYQLPTSFVFNQETKVLHVVLHVPLYREAHILTLYRYVPIPILLPSSQNPTFIELKPSKTYLARSRDGTLTRTLSLAELEDCLSMGHAYFCDDQALEKPKQHNCLNNLFSGINKDTFNLCDSHLLPYASALTRINITTYLLTESSPTIANSECLSTKSPRTSTIPIPIGTHYLNIDPNCTTSTEKWVISPTNAIPDTIIQSVPVTNRIDPSSFLTDLHPNDLKYIEAALHQIGQPIPISQVKGLIAFRATMMQLETEYQTTRLLAPTGISLLTISLIIGIGTALWFCRKRQKHQITTPHQPDAMPLLTRNEYAPPANIVTTPANQPTVANSSNTNPPLFQFSNTMTTPFSNPITN